MGLDTLYIIGQMDLEEFQTQFALQCAPVIEGLKVSNLLIIHRNQLRELHETLNRSFLSWYTLCVKGERATILIYDENRLKKYLSMSNVREMMQEFGYTEDCLQRILMRLRKKYHAYEANQLTFPHELGLLLGYPVEDVKGFIHNQGNDCLYTGYWKVYHNLPLKLELFKAFERAQHKLIRMVAGGATIREIIGGI